MIQHAAPSHDIQHEAIQSVGHCVSGDGLSLPEKDGNGHAHCRSARCRESGRARVTAVAIGGP